TRSVTIRGPAKGRALVRPGSLRHAIDVAYGNYVTERFAHASPDSIAPADRRTFFRFLTDRIGDRDFPENRDAKPTTAAELASAPHAARILAVLRLRQSATSD